MVDRPLVRLLAAVAAAGMVTVAGASCRGDAGFTTTTTATGASAGIADADPVAGGLDPTAPCMAADPPLRVDEISAAVTAVEAERGGAQRYYEINANDLLVNLFVASDGDTATPYVFIGGALTAGEPVVGASGNTFAGASLVFEPRLVMSCVVAQLPESTPTAFEIVGGPESAVRYSVVTASSVGGQLVIEVAGDGSVVAVDPV